MRQLLMFPRKAIVSVKGFSDAKADKVLESAHKLLPESDCGGFVTAAEDAERRKDVLHITSGCAAVDAILNGGFETRAITEIFGEWRCGKTQLCHTIAVTTQMPLKWAVDAPKLPGSIQKTRFAEIAWNPSPIGSDWIAKPCCPTSSSLVWTLSIK